MMRMYLLAAAVLVGNSPAAPVPKELQTSAPGFVGTWKIESLSSNGKKSSIAGYFIIDAAGSCMCHSDATFATFKPDRTYRFDPQTNFLDARFAKEPIIPGMYKLEGDTLLMAFTLNPGTNRPKSVEAGPTINLFTLKRVVPQVKK